MDNDDNDDNVIVFKKRRQAPTIIFKKRQNRKILLKLELHEGIVIDRPSKIIRSPYLADVLVDEDSVLCHSPALGCCGLIISEAKVLMTKKDSKTAKSKYSVDFVYSGKTLVGVNPNYGNVFAKVCILNNYIPEIPILDTLKSEYTINQSRLDFFGKIGEKKYYIEVKCVPLADYVDVNKKERHKFNNEQFNYNEKIAIFPDGYRKNMSEPVSERALKHAKHLTELKKEDENNVCILIFFIQRSDCKYFQASNLDPIYKKAVKEAYESGVLILPYSVDWIDGTAYLGKQLIFNP